MRLFFGPSGVPLSTKKRSTEEGIKRCKELGLDAMEILFVQGVKMSEEKAREVREVKEKTKIRLTVHGPYWINLNSKDKEKERLSLERILQSARIGWIAGAKSLTFHAAFYGGDDKKRFIKGSEET